MSRRSLSSRSRPSVSSSGASWRSFSGLKWKEAGVVAVVGLLEKLREARVDAVAVDQGLKRP